MPILILILRLYLDLLCSAGPGATRDRDARIEVVSDGDVFAQVMVYFIPKLAVQVEEGELSCSRHISC
jgi:hypothetical protein